MLQRLVTRMCVASFAAVLLLAYSSSHGQLRAQEAASPVAREVRALWVTRATLTSPASISRMIRVAQDAGFNTLLVQVRGRGDAYFSSTSEPRASELTSRPDFDPLAAILEQGHAAGLQVHAWIAANLVSSAFELPASRQHVVYRQPDWLMVPREIASELLRLDTRNPDYVARLARWSRANTARVEGLYTSPIHPAAVQYLAALVHELVTNYAVDGVHLDYVRFPGEDFDYSRGALDQFKASVRPDLTAGELRTLEARERHEPLIFVNMYPERWSAFRRSRLTASVMRLRAVVKTARPTAIISAAVVPDVDAARTTRFQDWRTWLDQDLIDVLCPMAYSMDSQVFARQIGAAHEMAGDRPVWAGVGAYRMASAQTVAYIAAARRLGAAGIVLFSYDSLVAPPNSTTSLTDLGRAAFFGNPPLP